MERKKILKNILTTKDIKRVVSKKTISLLINEQLKSQWECLNTSPIEESSRLRIWNNITRRRTTTAKPSVSSLRRHFIPYMAASIFLLLLGIGVFLQNKNTPLLDPEFITIKSSKNQEYILPDSSKVWMQKNSCIRFSQDFTEKRTVWAEGNCIFDVRKIENSIFVVNIHQASIEVKGTRFQIIQRSDEEINITLFTGRIDVYSDFSDKKISMKPLEELSLNTSNQSMQISQFNNFNWENEKYIFSDISLTELVKKIEILHQVKIELRCKNNIKASFTGSIRHDEPLDEILEKVCYSLDLKFMIENDVIIIQN